jgi:hypothetical protein
MYSLPDLALFDVTIVNHIDTCMFVSPGLVVYSSNQPTDSGISSLEMNGPGFRMRRRFVWKSWPKRTLLHERYVYSVYWNYMSKCHKYQKLSARAYTEKCLHRFISKHGETRIATMSQEKSLFPCLSALRANLSDYRSLLLLLRPSTFDLVSCLQLL